MGVALRTIGIFGIGWVLVACAGCATTTADASHGAAAPDRQTSASQTPSTTPSATPVGFTIPTACVDVVPASQLDYFKSAGMTLVEGPGSPSPAPFDRLPVLEDTTDVGCLWATPDYSSSVSIYMGRVTDANRQKIMDERGSDFYDDAASGAKQTIATSGVFAEDPGVDFPAIVDTLYHGAWLTITVVPHGDAALQRAVDLTAEVVARTRASE
ncbi:MAG: hypothetical protein ABIO06_01575 [Pseudolysinimonas sp.]